LPISAIANPFFPAENFRFAPCQPLNLQGSMPL